MRKSTSLVVLSVLLLAGWGCGDGGGGGTAKGGTTGSGGKGGTTGSAGTTGGGGSAGGSSGGAVAGSSGGAVAGSGGGGAAGRGGTGGGAAGTGGGAAGTAGGGAAGTGGGAAGRGGTGGGAAGTGGGAAGTAGGGAAGTGGGGAAGTGTGGAPATCTAMWTGDAKRPQLTDASAACYTIDRYLAQTGTIGALTTDNWNPTAGLPAASSFTPMFTVAADGSGTHTTVQAAITAAKAVTGGARVYVLVKPGTYRELVCIDGTVPITLYGANTDATMVTIAFNNYSGKTVDANVNACSNPTTANPPKTTYGTSDSTTVFVKAPGFQALNLTISNDTDEIAAGNPSSIQAVALTTQGDQGVFQNVRLLGNQDTLQVKTSAVTVAARMYFKNSYIEGDTDFIFGRATAVFDGCTLFYVSGRKTNSTHISPSTETPLGFGFLIINSKIMGATSISGTTLLGRAWDDSSGTMPNGQAIIRETQIANHINVTAPWGVAATSSRAFDANTNRLYEYKNTGTGAAP